MLAFDPLMGEVREFDLYAGGVFEAGNEVFLVTMSGAFSLRVIDMFGRSRSVDECELYVMERCVVPVVMRRLGVRLCRS
mgnify:CR=1 FL=1|jgi:hypothetical protein